MALVDILLSRRSVRRYETKTVPADVVKTILEAGRQAPSASNVQPWHFIVLTDDEIKEQLSHGRWNTFIKDSAFTIVGCGYIGNEYGRKWSTVDTTIALQNMVIAAWALGIGSCWIGDFIEDDVKELLRIPDDQKVVALISFGYPAEQPGSKQKKPLTEIVGYNGFE
jgi:nitroreductase